MNAESNKALVRRYVAAFNRGDTGELRELFSADAQIVGVLGTADLETALGVWQELHAAFRITLEIDALAADGENVAARYRERGEFVAPFRGQAATGKPYELLAIEWFVIQDGRITRRWGSRDSAAMNRQLGI